MNSFLFGNQDNLSSSILVSETDLYTPEKGYGFVIEENRRNQELLQIPELNSGFDTWYWLNAENISCLYASAEGIYTQKSNPDLMKGWPIPLHFKANVASGNNYTLQLKIQTTEEACDYLYIFTGRRRLMTYLKNIPAHTELNRNFTVNISDIIPRSKTTPYTDLTFDLTLVSSNPVALSKLTLTPDLNAPTLYIAGDSTVTDQFTSYPYNPGCSYCGWAQMLPAFFNSGISVSNHSHSGLTTQSFRSEGHYAIIENIIKPGDYCLFQFGHNDQKLPELDAYGGYTRELVRYIHEIRDKGAQPVIVTPLARNTWLSSGSYNDLLADYANACLRIGEEEKVPVIDLHQLSKDFIITNGLERSKAYFYPNDYTHTNDYGGFQMAGFVSECLQNLNLPLNTYVTKNAADLTECLMPPEIPVAVPKAPEGFIDQNAPSFAVPFTDINQCPEADIIRSLTCKGIISNRDSLFHPNAVITRVEVLEWIIKAVGFVPMNVYNDYYPDVIGHEWYAGVVEVAHQNELVDPALTSDSLFHPNAPVTGEELVSFLMKSYKCRKALPTYLDSVSINAVSNFALEAVQAAQTLHLIPKEFVPQEKISRRKAATYISKFIKLI